MAVLSITNGLVNWWSIARTSRIVGITEARPASSQPG
jgi:hypothetical protein